jgi:hypothetical protein
MGKSSRRKRDAFVEQRLPDKNRVFAIDVENLDCRPADTCQALERSSLPFEVASPPIGSWVARTSRDWTRIGTMNRYVRPAAKRLGTVARSTRCGRGPAALRQKEPFAMRVHGEVQRSGINAHRDHEPVRSSRGETSGHGRSLDPLRPGTGRAPPEGAIRDARSWSEQAAGKREASEFRFATAAWLSFTGSRFSLHAFVLVNPDRTSFINRP